MVLVGELTGDRGWRLKVVKEPWQEGELRGTVDVQDGEYRVASEREGG